MIDTKVQKTCHGVNEIKAGPLAKVHYLHIMVYYQTICILIINYLICQHVQLKRHSFYSNIPP